MLFGDDLIVWLLLAMGGALFVGNVRSEEHSLNSSH